MDCWTFKKFDRLRDLPSTSSSLFWITLILQLETVILQDNLKILTRKHIKRTKNIQMVQKLSTRQSHTIDRHTILFRVTIGRSNNSRSWSTPRSLVASSLPPMGALDLWTRSAIIAGGLHAWPPRQQQTESTGKLITAQREREMLQNNALVVRKKADCGTIRNYCKLP